MVTGAPTTVQVAAGGRALGATLAVQRAHLEARARRARGSPYSAGGSQAANGAPSSEHSNVASAAFAENENAAVVGSSRAGGPTAIVGLELSAADDRPVVLGRRRVRCCRSRSIART